MKTAVKLCVLLSYVAIATCSILLAGCQNKGSEPGNRPAAATPSPASSPSPVATAPSTAAESQTGAIEVKSTPPGASIMLIANEGDAAGSPESKGTTPAMVTGVAPGKYTVDIELTGYKYFQKDIEVKPGSTVKVDARLRKQ